MENAFCGPSEANPLCCANATAHGHFCVCQQDFTECPSSSPHAVSSCALKAQSCGPGAHRVDSCQ
jgi:hypothetical protein